MTENTSAQVEMSIALPLDVVANKLMRIEEELRYLNMKLLNFERERESGGLNGVIGARLERIDQTLDSIRARLSDLDADSQPTRYGSSRLSPKQPRVSEGDSDEDDSSEYADRKPRPDRDD